MNKSDIGKGGRTLAVIDGRIRFRSLRKLPFNAKAGCKCVARVRVGMLCGQTTQVYYALSSVN
ncbi:hypothetical protein [Afifella pfennigii]|uniref:hypothetical protein n=1 Tax=Afifella pfennigii TaxID=209897 RepID=UPI0012EBF33A|nr:hypothetical protein [Afifella pfennigii]